MRILYGIQGTGNGHLSRAQTNLPILNEIASKVDILISADKHNLQLKQKINFQKKGLSFEIQNGKIDYWKTIKGLNLLAFKKEIEEINFNQYDVIISDFEPLTAWGAKWNNIPSIQISHQASFLSKKSPRPKNKSLVAEGLLKYFSPCNDFIGLHYKSYDENILEPIINEKIKDKKCALKEHFSVYLPWENQKEIVSHLQSLDTYKFELFSPVIKTKERNKNVSIHPISMKFTESLLSSQGVISNCGFETTSEALYLGKKLVTLPLNGQYEQECNAAALRDFGIPCLSKKSFYNKEALDLSLNKTEKKLVFNNDYKLKLRNKIMTITR